MPKVKGIPTVRFTLFSTKELSKLTYIHLYFHYRGKRLRYATGEKVCPAGWDFTKQRAVCNRKYPEGVDINATLNTLEELTRRIYRDTNLGDIAPADFSHELDVRMGYVPKETIAPPQTLLNFSEEWITKYSTDHPHRRSTWKTLFLTLKQLKSYAAERGVRLQFSEINNEFLNDLIVWLYTPPRQYSRNYVAFIVKRLKMLMQKAFEQGLHDNRVYLGFKYNEIDSDEIALSFSDLNTIEQLDFSDNERLDRVRDVFLIGCFTGLRASDYKRIRPEHIIEESGIKVLSITTQKTGKKVKIPIFPILERLLKKYDFKIPNFSDNDFSRDAKEVCRLAGFTDKILLKINRGGSETEEEIIRYTKVTSHTPRRSFATNFILAKIPIHLVMAILGHKTESETRKYARISESQSAKSFSLEIESLKDSPDTEYLFK